MDTAILKHSSNRLFFITIVLVVLSMLGVYYFQPFRTAPPAHAVNMISPTLLEEQYGLQVSLIAVTAAGGFVDVRIKIVDGEKAKLLLSEKENFPALWIKDGVILNAPEETKSQEIRFDNDGTMFIMYVNSANVVKPGTPVSIRFGDTMLEPLNAN